MCDLIYDFDQFILFYGWLVENNLFFSQMEGLQQLNFNQQMNESLNLSRLADENLDQVTLHCKRDHFSPGFHQNKSNSCYHSSYTPVKTPHPYNQVELEKGLTHFRKYENSTSLLPSIPKISQHSHYQKEYHGQSSEKPQKAHQKQTFFLKLNWALDPASNYQKDFLNRDGSVVNQNNAERPNHNQLAVFKFQQQRNRTSNYRNDFKAFTIKKEAELSIKARDHMKPATKQNYPGETNLSEYQRRYESVMELTKKKENIGSIYKKEPISRKCK